MNAIYQCPVCNQKLSQLDKSFVCAKNHTYDIAREGYVNLLLANQKKTKDPGDSKFMVENREFFLAKGYYNPLADEINKKISERIQKTEIDTSGDFNILDVGCGIGTYVGKLQEFFKKKNLEKQARLWGIDISKPAIQKAAKKYPEASFCIGSNFHLPYADASSDIIFSIFSPFDTQELLRVLKPGGTIVLVRPGPDHLKELAALLYDEVKLQGNRDKISENTGILLTENKQLKFQIHLENNEEIMSLIAMTPYYWHFHNRGKSHLAKIKKLTVSVEFQISLLQCLGTSYFSARGMKFVASPDR